jgi:molybdate transport system substrate-binding protein
MTKPMAQIALALTVAMMVAACSGDEPGQRTGKTQLTVFAASSLTSTFESMGRQFEAEHPNTVITFNFGGSSDLVTQVSEGAPVDVIATADAAQMEKLVTADLLDGDPANFASNTLEIAVPPDNPGNVNELADLGQTNVKLVVCAPEVPCGSAAAKVAEAAGITLTPVSEEASVADVLGKVVSGEADAGLVYVTDVIAAGSNVTGVPIPEARSAVNTYPIATVGASDNRDLAGEFVDLVLSPEGQRILTDAGFGQP